MSRCRSHDGLSNQIEDSFNKEIENLAKTNSWEIKIVVDKPDSKEFNFKRGLIAFNVYIVPSTGKELYTIKPQILKAVGTTSNQELLAARSCPSLIDVATSTISVITANGSIKLENIDKEQAIDSLKKLLDVNAWGKDKQGYERKNCPVCHQEFPKL